VTLIFNKNLRFRCSEFIINRYYVSNLLLKVCSYYHYYYYDYDVDINPLNAELTPTCHLLVLLGVHYFLHVSRIRVKSLTLRLLMSHIYGAPILDVSRSHTTTHHSR